MLRLDVRSAVQHRAVPYLIVMLLLLASPAMSNASAFRPIEVTDRSTVILTGHDLTLEELVRIARHGAQVALSTDAEAAERANYGLLLEAAAEGVPVYWFNRGSGDQRETVIFEGDPLAPQNRALIEKTQSDSFRAGAAAGIGPDVEDEAEIRAMMAIRANTMVYTAPSADLAHRLIDLLNHRVTPVVRSRGTVGEGDLAPLGNVGGTLIGVGEAYFEGQRMPARTALARAGLTPIKPFGADDNALTSSNAYAVARAALVVEDARQLLGWTDLGTAMALEGMNSSVTPLSSGVQRERPDPWLNWHAAYMLNMVKDSYLFEEDKGRIIQDPESLRAASIRGASAWREWALLRDAVLFQMNSADHNPAIARGLAPTDSWELSTPQLLHFYVRGGALSHGEHGYILSNANWDPYPFANRVESFSIALSNLMVAVMGRIERFHNPFFTGVSETDVLPDYRRSDDSLYAPVDLGQEIISLSTAIPPAGVALFATIEDLEAETRLKIGRSRQIVDTAFELEACDLLESGLWMDIRSRQKPTRAFGQAPTAALAALRRIAPLETEAPNIDRATTPTQGVVVAFLRRQGAEQFNAAAAGPPTHLH